MTEMPAAAATNWLSRLFPLMLLLFLLLLLHHPACTSANQAKQALCASESCDNFYAVVLDAGSTGTRVQVFRFRRSHYRNGDGPRRLQLLWNRVSKKEPGLSVLSDSGNPRKAVANYLSPLVSFAKSLVPKGLRAGTPVYLGATAGLRALAAEERDLLIRASARLLRSSGFKAGGKMPDSDLASVLTGRDEASFGWLSANFLTSLSSLENMSARATAFFGNPSVTYGYLDLGGGSVQMAVQVRKKDAAAIQQHSRAAANVVGYRLLLPDSSSKLAYRNVTLFLRNYDGLGKEAATLRILGYSARDRKLLVYRSPCLNPAYAGVFTFGSVTVNISGEQVNDSVSRWNECAHRVSDILSLLPKQVSAVRNASSSVKYLAINAFYYVARSLSRLGYLRRPIPGPVALFEFATAGDWVCKNPPTKGRYAPYLCLDSAYIYYLLKNVIELPDQDKVYFANSIGGKSLSWALGKALSLVGAAGRNR